MVARPLAMLVFACPVVVGAAPPEVELGHQQLELAQRRDILSDDPEQKQIPWQRTSAFAQLTGGGRAGGDVGVGMSAAMSGINCDLVAASAQGRLRPFGDDGEPLGEVTYSTCPLGALFTIKLDGRRATGLMPAIDARRSLWNRMYTEAYDRTTIGFGPIWDEDDDPRHSIFMVALGHGTTTQHDGSETRTIKTLDLELSVYRYHRPLGLQLDAIVVTSDGMKAGSDDLGGVTSEFLPVRLRYETPELYAAASAGWGFTGGTFTASGSTSVNDRVVDEWQETIDGSGLPQMSMLVADLEAGVRRDRLSASGRVARSYYPTFDGNVAREARVSGTITYVAGRSRRTSISLAPFATRTRTWLRDAGSTRDISAGATVHVGRELTSGLRVADRTTKLRIDAIGQAGVSPYARSVDERLASGSVGGQVLVAVSGRVIDLHH